MKKELALHFFTTIILFVPIFLLKFLDIAFLPYLIGGLIGAVLPDIDHVIYVFYLRPNELTSQRVAYEVKKGDLMTSWNVLSETRNERTNLIFHTVLFQILFILLSFLVVTSGSSLVGKGLVISFLLHLLVDQFLDLKQTGGISNWFKNIPVVLDNVQIDVYLLANLIVILVFAFLL